MKAAWQNELRETWQLAWPLIIAQLAQIGLFTTDVVMMGWLGPQYLAAGTLATALLHPLTMLGIGTLSAVSPLIAQALGSRQIKPVRRITRQGCWVALLLSSLFVPVMWQIRWILQTIGQTEELSLLAEDFMHMAVWSFYPALLFTVLRCFLAAHNSTWVILIITVLGVAFNVLCNYALIFGHWGFPRLELRGSGISTTLVYLLMLLMLVIYISCHRRFRRYHLFLRFWRPDWMKFRLILKIGLPIGCMLTAEVGLFSAAAIMMGWLGKNELAAHAVALQCAGIAFMIPLGLSQATTIRVGRALGARDREGIGRAGWVSYGLGIGAILCSMTLMMVIPEKMVGLFFDRGDSATALSFTLAVSYLGVAALFQLADATQVIGAAALRGINDTAKPMLVGIVGYWIIGLSAAYFLAFPLHMRGLGIWYGLATGLAVVAFTLTLRFARREHFGLLRSI